MEAAGGKVPKDEALEEIEREAEEVLPAPAGHPRFPLLDSMRAIAAISVLLVHVGIFSGGFEAWYKQPLAHLDIGVPFFFLLSGFLLYRPMLASRVSGLPRQKLSDYGRNRFFRILPAYWAALTITAIVPGMYGAFTGNWWVYYGLLQNYPVYTAEGQCAVGTLRCGVPPSWTLAVEIAFYIVLPLFALLMAAVTRHRRNWFRIEIGVLALLAAVSVFIQATVSEGGNPDWLFFSPLGRAWWFATGMGLAACSVHITVNGVRSRAFDWIREHPGTLWIGGITIYLLMTYLLLDNGPSLNAPTASRSDYVIQYVLVGVIALLVVTPAVFTSQAARLPRRILEHPVLIWLGLISYGIFLWHYPVVVALMDLGAGDLPGGLQLPFLAVATLLVTIVLAALSYYLLEKPLRLWARRLGSGSAGVEGPVSGGGSGPAPGASG